MSWRGILIWRIDLQLHCRYILIIHISYILYNFIKKKIFKKNIYTKHMLCLLLFRPYANSQNLKHLHPQYHIASELRDLDPSVRWPGPRHQLRVGDSSEYLHRGPSSGQEWCLRQVHQVPGVGGEGDWIFDVFITGQKKEASYKFAESLAW